MQRRQLNAENVTATCEVVNEKGERNRKPDWHCRLRLKQWIVTPFQSALRIITARKTRRNGRDERRNG
jgi:hypothetical protein